MNFEATRFGIVLVSIEEPKEIRQWLFKMNRGKEFNHAVAKSHEEGQVECLVAGNHTIEGSDFDLSVNFLFRINIAAGSILEGGRCIALLCCGKLQQQLCRTIILSLVAAQMPDADEDDQV